MSDNPLQIKRLHHIEFLVGSARQAAFFYRQALGFSQAAYAGLETGQRSYASYVMVQNKVTFVFSTPIVFDEIMSNHIRKHGDGVRDIAFEVEDVDHAFETAVSLGAEAAVSPRSLADRNGTVRYAAIRTYGDTIHSFISKNGYDGPFLPGYESVAVPAKHTGILNVDHLVGNVELGRMNFWAEWYQRVLGFRRYMSFDDKDISTEYSALMSIVMASDSTALKLPINEPAPGRHKSQIQEYLDFYQGPGVQHIALLTGDIISTVNALRENGTSFLSVPDSYYQLLPERIGSIHESIDDIHRLGILADRDEEGYLLQIFTEPVSDRPTLFFEIIQRKGSRGFGKGNFRALFEAIEREQARRGNL